MRAAVILLVLILLSMCLTDEESSKSASHEEREILNIRVIDGDTFDINGERVRVIGIDAMEYKHAQKNYVVKKLGVENVSCLDYYGKKAYEFALNVFRSSERVEVKPIKKDKYGRTLAYVYICNETCSDYSELVLSKGLAIVYVYDEYAKKGEYLEIENKAREMRIGLWSCT